ncbi:MAG: NAD(P)H-hydrate dehydratase [Bacteroidetes bacterium]|nr:NAD(P)H-hydrate dehydratase [Bacteroidota bacterium]
MISATKILNIAQIRQADAYTIAHEPISSVDLMERAAGNLYNALKPRLGREKQILIFCGTGNNGGDGLVLARKMLEDGFHAETFVLRMGNNESNDFTINLERLLALGGKVQEISNKAQFPTISSHSIVVDALFGSGLSRPLDGTAAELVLHINESEAIVISVDMPSGLFADKPMPKGLQAVVQADYTFTFELPRLAFLMPENEFFVGNWQVIPICLHPDYLAQADTHYYYLEAGGLAGLLKGRRRHAHKGDFGHALLIAGSRDKGGAALLAAGACLRSGTGLLHVHLPQAIAPALLAKLPEAMISPEDADCFTRLPELSPYHAIGVGPGLGTAPETANALKLLIQQSRVPLILDADALNLLAEHPTWLAFLPKGSILTPHPGEFRRLTGSWTDSFERLEMQRAMSLKHGLIIVLKGAYTCVSMPDGRCFFNSSGNPGMATAGSGDVLTGVITGLVSRGYSPHEAALLGVYLHGLAGDLAAETLGFESLIASDITAHLGKAFAKLQEIRFNQP